MKVITQEDKNIVIQGIIDNALKSMQRIITQKSSKNRAKVHSKSHKQSTKAITYDTIFFNTITGKQQLPFRPRDFRMGLAEEERGIGRAELSDVLSSITNKNILENKRNSLSFSRGRPASDSHLVEEKRGRLSYYEPSKIKQIIDEILNDSQTIKIIDNAIIGTELFYRFIKYSFEVHFYQMREDPSAFLKSLKPAIMKYGISQRKKEELDNTWIDAKELTEDKIGKLSKEYALHTISNLEQDARNIVYTIAGLYFFHNEQHT